jgi:transglutaminase-like putative cysteine protease
MNPQTRPLGHAEHGVLLAQLGLVLAPQARTLPFTFSLLLAMLMLWRWLLWRQRAALPARGMLAVVATMVVAVAGLVVWQDGGNIGRELSVALLSAFVILKLLECRALADATLVTQLCFYLLLSLYLFDQPFWLAVYTLGTGAWILRNWLFLQHPQARGRIAPWPLLGRMATAALPWALVLFVLFPRLERPLWRLPQSAPTASTGISDTMSPGSVARLTPSADIALRADTGGKLLAPSQLYWRALVLWQFDGSTWRTAPLRQGRMRPAPAAPEDGRLDAAGDLDYTITLEPTQRQWLFVLDRGQAIDRRADATVSPDGEFLTRAPIGQRLLYRARSAAAAPETLDAQTRQLALRLPAGNPRARALAAQWSERHPDPARRAQAALALFAAAPFAYTLSPPALGGEQIDSFLFGTRRGFCEHYAGSFVFLMRAAGVPARVVTGYQGGEFNPVGGHYVVRQADAHAWAEIWLDGQGWVRVDPTQAVAPSRIERGIDALEGNDIEAVRDVRQPGWLRELRWGADGLVHHWHRWVLQYDHRMQMQLLTQVGLGGKLVPTMLVSMVVLATLAVVPLWLRQRRRAVDPVQSLYMRFGRELERHGCVRAPGEGPLDFAQRVAQARPAAADAVRAFTKSYVDMRYGGPATGTEQPSVATLRRSLQHVRTALRQEARRETGGDSR